MTDPADALYALDPDDFVAARDALAAQLRKDGDPATAAAVKALRRPAVPVWLLNLVARSDAGLVQRAADVGAALRAAQVTALGGGGGAALRDLAAQRRSLVDDVVRWAVELAEEHGRDASAATRDAVASTVEAALADESVMAQWAAGTLRAAADPAGFGFGDAVPVPSPARERAPAKPARPEPRPAAAPKAGRSERTDADETAERRRRLDEATEKAGRLRSEADAAKAEVARRKAEAADADRAAKAARQALREAERAASRADLFAATAEQAAWEIGERTRG